MAQANTAGYFGKLPSNGDFVSRNLGNAFTQPWDRWLQSAIGRSRELLGDSWLDIYLTSPVWRFVLAPGICADQAWAGVLMPSVDRVGRYFPLTIAAAVPPNWNPFQLAAEGMAWFEQAESAALSALEDTFERDVFDRRVDELGFPEQPALLEDTGPAGPPSGEAWHLGLGFRTGLCSAYAGLLQWLLTARMERYTLWWSNGSNRLGPSLLVSQSLPPGDRFSALLDGDWARWGWQQTQTFSPLGMAGTSDTETEPL